MPQRVPAKTAGLALMISALAAPLPAHAGFQWIAPNDTAQMQQPVQMAPSSSGSGYSAPARPLTVTQGPEIISPVVISGQNQSQDNSGEMPVYNGSAAMSPGGYTQLRSAPAPQPQPQLQPMSGGSLGTLSMGSGNGPAPDSTVQGFAKNVPLVVALRQILPSGYAFSVDANIDMGTPVSFHGGRGWRETLRDTLAPVGLAMREQGQMVSIGHANDASMQAMAPAPAPEPMRSSGTLSSVAARTGVEPEPMRNPGSLNPTDTPIGASFGGTMLPESGVWSAERGENLKKVLEEWSRRANVEFDWLAEYDYPMQASVSFSGTFEEAVRSLLAGFEGAHPQPVAELHSNPALKQTVLVVQTRGNTNSD